jgi:flagellar hook assembly protein FlgD
MRPQIIKKMNPIIRMLVGVSLLPLALAGCSGGSSNSGGNNAPSTPRSVSATAPDGLTSTVSENTQTISVGGSVTYTFTLINNTSAPITFQVESGSAALVSATEGAITIYNASQQQVYPITTDTVAGVLSSVTLAPGQSVSGSATPNYNFTPAGVYTAEATFAILSASGAYEGVTVGPLTVTAQ